MRLKISALLFLVSTTGCVARVGYSGRGYIAPAPVYANTTVSYQGPDLVDVGGGVQVIADYDEPVFYTDNYYWRYYGNTWYRSNIHTGGWVVYNDVPYSVRRIDRPTTYVRYRPTNWQPRAQRGPVVRDNRTYQPQPQPQPYNGGPTVRDHRTQPQPQPYGGGPVVRDHRTQPQPEPQGPVVRDHRTQPQPPGPVVRDHRTQPQPQPQPKPQTPAPVVRDQRTQPQPQPRPPVTRDHRR